MNFTLTFRLGHHTTLLEAQIKGLTAATKSYCVIFFKCATLKQVVKLSAFLSFSFLNLWNRPSLNSHSCILPSATLAVCESGGWFPRRKQKWLTAKQAGKEKSLPASVLHKAPLQCCVISHLVAAGVQHKRGRISHIQVASVCEGWARHGASSGALTCVHAATIITNRTHKWLHCSFLPPASARHTFATWEPAYWKCFL